MKLTKRQKTILLISGGIFLLAIFITTAVIINAVQKPTPPPVSVPPRRDFPNPNDNPSLTQAKGEAVTFLQQKLLLDNISETNLIQKLKTKNYLETDQNNWKDYLDNASTSQELEVRKTNILTIMGELTGNPYVPPHPEEDSGPSRDPNYFPGPDRGGSWWLNDDEIRVVYAKDLINHPSNFELLPPSIVRNTYVNQKADNSLFNHEILFLPINNAHLTGQSGSGSHWALLVYQNSMDEFHYYDSGGGFISNAEEIAKILLKSKDLNHPKLNNPGIVRETTPRQPDGSSCGVYVIMISRYLVEKYQNRPIIDEEFWKIEKKSEDFANSIKKERELIKKLRREEKVDDGNSSDFSEWVDFNSWGYSRNHQDEVKRVINLPKGQLTALQSFLIETKNTGKISEAGEKILTLDQLPYLKRRSLEKNLLQKMSEVALIMRLTSISFEAQGGLGMQDDAINGRDGFLTQQNLRGKPEGEKFANWTKKTYTLSEEEKNEVKGYFDEEALGKVEAEIKKVNK